ncbi:uncharacterized protein A4U43_C10F5560 [Asparagus officinalis]|uniref:Uncharacterized protein n=1 Tax=Asparagus officinalis TaxID=4686 RepID=A0A5P1E0W8_ASPOF|nr:uncharacterized protein A4U43_C10F5560 [Asparagus officinalis]
MNVVVTPGPSSRSLPRLALGPLGPGWAARLHRASRTSPAYSVLFGAGRPAAEPLCFAVRRVPGNWRPQSPLSPPDAHTSPLLSSVPISLSGSTLRPPHASLLGQDPSITSVAPPTCLFSLPDLLTNSRPPSPSASSCAPSGPSQSRWPACSAAAVLHPHSLSLPPSPSPLRPRVPRGPPSPALLTNLNMVLFLLALPEG